MQKDPNARGVGWLLVAVLLVILDSVLKWQAIGKLPLASSVLPDGLFGLGLYKNPGVLFSLELPYAVLIPFPIVLLTILTFLGLRAWSSSPRLAAGALITCAGAIGNFLDRLFNGFTTDYLLFHPTGAAFNLSDLVIFVGIVLLCTAPHPKDPHIPLDKGR